jgi:hypothetical protein
MLAVREDAHLVEVYRIGSAHDPALSKFFGKI